MGVEIHKTHYFVAFSFGIEGLWCTNKRCSSKFCSVWEFVCIFCACVFVSYFFFQFWVVWIVSILFSLSDGIYKMTAFLLKAHCLANTKTDLLHPKNGTIVFACVCYLFGCCYCCLTSSFSWFLLRKAIKTRAHKGVCHWFAFEQCNLRFMSPC